MAITDKSAIPLNVHDLRVVEGVPKFNDGRLALRLDLDRNDWRALIKRHEPGAIQRGLETLTHGAAKSSGGRSYRDWFLTIEQTIYYTSRSKAENALDVMAEVAQIVGAVRRGAPIPDTPWTDALLAPDKPAITRRDDNVVHVKHEEPLYDLFDTSPSFDEPRAPNAFKRDVWIEDEDGISYVVTKERDAVGNVCDFDYLRNPPIHTSTDHTVKCMPWINGTQVRLRFNHIIPLAVFERTYLNQLPDGPVKNAARNTLRWFLAF